MEIELPQDVSEALALLAGADPLVRPVSGATDVMLRVRAGRLRARRLISVFALDALGQLEARAGGVALGANVTAARLLKSPLIQDSYRALWLAAQQFASPQIRNRATVAGNIANASPAADLVPPLLALGAQVTAVSQARGARTVPLESLFLGFGKTALAADELLTQVVLPKPRATFQAFAKFGSRGANVIAVVNMAMALELDGERIRHAKVAFGSVAPKPLVAEQVSAALVGEALNEALIRRIGEVVRAEVTPIDDVRGSKQYKESLAVNAVEDALERCLDEVRA